MKLFSKIFSYIDSLRYIPHILVFYLSQNKDILIYERDRWLGLMRIDKRKLPGFLLLIKSLPEYRSLFYFRTGHKWLSYLSKGQNNLEFYTESEKIGRGLVIWHGFSTVVNVESMGEDCQVWHNVTLGKKTINPINDRPVIKNRVSVSAGSILIGNIEIGDDAVIGAGAIVVKDVPSNSTIVSVPSRIL